MDLSFPSDLTACSKDRLQTICSTLDLNPVGSKTDLLSRLLHTVQLAGFRNWSDFVLQKDLGNEQQPIQCVCGLQRARVIKSKVKCERCGTYQHRACVSPCLGLSPYECPRCQLEQLDPFQPVLQFLTPPAFVSSFLNGGTGTSFKTSFVGNSDYKTGTSRAQVRCLKLSNTGYTHIWPTETLLILDEKQVLELSESSGTRGRKRKDYPLILSLDSGPHKVALYKRKDEENFVYAVVLTQKKPASEVIETFLRDRTISWEQGKAFVDTFFKGGEELQMKSLKQSLRCPLSHLVVKTPVRGWKCKHLQCFDLQTFVLLQEDAKVNKWRCPICSRNCCKLIVDKYWESILIEAGNNGLFDLAEFLPSGEHRLLPSDLHEETSMSPPSLKRKISLSPGCSRGKTPKLQTGNQTFFPPENDQNALFSWEDFEQRKIAQDDIYSSETYQKIALMRSERIWKTLLSVQKEVPPPRASIKRLSNKSPGRLEQRQGKKPIPGSSNCPIDLLD